MSRPHTYHKNTHIQTLLAYKHNAASADLTQPPRRRRAADVDAVQDDVIKTETVKPDEGKHYETARGIVEDKYIYIYISGNKRCSERRDAVSVSALIPHSRSYERIQGDTFNLIHPLNDDVYSVFYT